MTPVLLRLVVASAFPTLLAAESAEECTINLQRSHVAEVEQRGKLLNQESSLEDTVQAALVQRSADLPNFADLDKSSLFGTLAEALTLKKIAERVFPVDKFGIKEEGLTFGIRELVLKRVGEVFLPGAPRPEVPGMCNVTQHSVDFECSYDQYGPHVAGRRRAFVRRRAAPRPESAGSVASLYTTGAPTPSECPLVNELQEGCCFDGLRVYARDSEGKYDPANVAAKAAGYSHVFMKSMELLIPDDPSGDYSEVLHECGEAGDRGRKVFLQDGCIDAFKCHVHSYWDWFFGPGAKGSQAEARRILSLTPYAIWGPDEPQKEGHFQDNMIRPKDLGFRLVGLFSEKLDPLGMDDDGVMLYQGGDKECYLTFSQTLSLSDWITNAVVIPTGWCGAEGIHYGWVKEIRGILDHPKYDCEIRSKLPSCASVTVAGYSLGGALAQIFSFCANRQSPGVGCNDFKRVTWTKGNTTELPDHHPGLCSAHE